MTYNLCLKVKATTKYFTTEIRWLEMRWDVQLWWSEGLHNELLLHVMLKGVDAIYYFRCSNIWHKKLACVMCFTLSATIITLKAFDLLSIKNTILLHARWKSKPPVQQMLSALPGKYIRSTSAWNFFFLEPFITFPKFMIPTQGVVWVASF